MTPRAMLDALNVVDMVLEYAEAELARTWLLAIPRQVVTALRTGIRHTKTDLSHLIKPGGSGGTP